jgi:hypothetical protein
VLEKTIPMTDMCTKGIYFYGLTYRPIPLNCSAEPRKGIYSFFSMS